jgi:hypothetical protein
MLATNIDTFDTNYEGLISYFKRLDNLGNIRRTNGSAAILPVDSKKIVTKSIVVGKSKKASFKI